MPLPSDQAVHPTGDQAAPADTLQHLIQQSGVELSNPQYEQLAQYRDLLYQHNQTTNLTAIRDLPGIERRLLLESLRLVAPLRALPPIDRVGRRSLIDVGTGGGLPGVILAIACPEFNVFLLDATGKKIAFLDRVIEKLELTQVTTVHGRAEDLGHEPRYRNGFDIVTARAVSSIPALLELGLPLLRVGGFMLLPKGTDIEEELASGHRAGVTLGGKIESHELLPASESTIETRLVVVRKLETTPRLYPRRSGIPSKSPLGTGPTRVGSGAGPNERGTT